MTPKVLISIDGGGIRGLIALRILKTLEKAAGAPIARRAHVFAGTSTGGIIALGLASGMSVDALIKLYEDHATTIFSRGLSKRLTSLFGLADEKYSSAPVEELLHSIFKDKTLRSVRRNEVVVTATNITTRKLHLFSSYYAKKDVNDDYPLRYAARATSAAPTYFEPVNFHGEALADGGLIANNPALITAMHIKKLYGWQGLENLKVISLGTGNHPTGVTHQQAKGMGALLWAAPISATIMQASSDMDDFTMKYLYHDMNSYIRLQPELPREIDLDSVSPEDFKDMHNVVDLFLNNNKDLLAEAVRILNGA